MKKFSELKVGDVLEIYDGECMEFLKEKVLRVCHLSSNALEIETVNMRFVATTNDIDVIRIWSYVISTSMDRLLLECEE